METIIQSQISKITQLKKWELIGYGKDAERQNDIYSAVDYYAEYMKRETENMKIAYKLAKMYFDINDFKRAKFFFGKVKDNALKKHPHSLYYFAEILRIESKYDSAIQLFNQFQDLSRKKKVKSFLYYMTEIKIESCQYAANNTKSKENYAVYHLNNTINKAHMESAPIIYNDSTFIYSSLVADSVPIFNSTNMSSRPFHRFFKAEIENHNWKGGLDAGEPFFNIDTLNSSNGAFSEDKKRFYFTLSGKNRFNKTISSIYMSEFKNNHWTKAIKLDENVNIKGYSSTQPTVCDYLNDYEIIYFVSDRPGGWGRNDIWYTVYNKNTESFNKAVNAGGYINSAGDEITPFYVADTKTMYFSSDSYPGYGGYDVFNTNGALVEWLPPENMGLPINSNYNDIYYKKYDKLEKGFLVSNRDESIDLKNPNCCYDIFEFKLPNKPKIKVNGYVALKKNNTIDEISGSNVKDKENEITIANKKLQLWMQSKVSGISVLIGSTTTNDNGFYEFSRIDPHKQYIVRVDDKTTLKKESDFSTENITYDSLLRIDTVYIEPIPTKPIIFQNIYFEYGNAELTNESKKTIDKTILKIMKSNTQIIVEIGAHTDYMGKEDYNLKLSQKRAESVVNYLIENGIEKFRLKPVGYGESKPLIPAQTSEGKDIPEAREKNRRIEFTVLGSI